MKARSDMPSTFEELAKVPYRIELIPDEEEGGYVARIPDLPGCMTCSETAEGALLAAEDAKRAWIAAALADGLEVPKPGSLDAYSGQLRLRMPRSLHRSLSEHSRREGVSMNQYCVYLLSREDSLAAV